jgi:hypothetical protein
VSADDGCDLNPDGLPGSTVYRDRAIAEDEAKRSAASLVVRQDLIRPKPHLLQTVARLLNHFQ